MTMQWLVITGPLSSMLSFKANSYALPAKDVEQVYALEPTLPVTKGILMLYYFIVRLRVVCLFLRTAVIVVSEVFGHFY